MSRICIRNMEVRDDLERWLESKDKGLRPGENGDFGILKGFFNKFRGSKGSYSIKTYDKELLEDKAKERSADKAGAVDKDKKEIKEKFHTVDFDPIGVLHDEVFKAIDDLAKDKGTGNDKDKEKEEKEKEKIELMSLFLNIYSPSDKLVFNRSYPISHIREIVTSSGIPGSNLLLDYIDEISKIHKDESINTIALVKYLASFPMLNSNLAKTIFDKESISVYITDFQNRLEQRVVIADSDLKAVTDQLAEIKKKGKSLFNEHDKLLKKANAVQDELSKMADEKMDLLMKINLLSARRSELEQEYKKSVGENPSQPQVFIPMDNKEMRDLTISITQNMSRMEKLDNVLIPEKKKESSRLLKELDNVSSQMDELSEQESSLQREKRNLTLQRDAAKERLDQAVKDLKSYK